jgi:hypothetical protein
MSDWCTLGSSSLDESTNSLLVQCKAAALGSDEAPDYGDTPIACALGVTARPAPADDRGAAEALVDTGVPGLDGVVTAARDTRSADVVANLGPGETALHSTGKDFDSRVFCKDQILALVIGDDLVMVMDRKEKKISIAGFGLAFEMSEKQGIVLSDGGAGIQIKDGTVSITGQVVLGGRSPVGFIHYSPAAVPVVGGVGGTSLPSPGVFIGA